MKRGASLPEGCTGHRDPASGTIVHDGATCPIHEEMPIATKTLFDKQGAAPTVTCNQCGKESMVLPDGVERGYETCQHCGARIQINQLPFEGLWHQASPIKQLDMFTYQCPNCHRNAVAKWEHPVFGPAYACPYAGCGHEWNDQGTITPGNGWLQDDATRAERGLPPQRLAAYDISATCPHCGHHGTSIIGAEGGEDQAICMYCMKTWDPSTPTLFDKQGSATRTERLNWAQEHENEYGPDTSDVHHTFPDGWTVREMRTPADHIREGELMGNCVGDPFHSTAEFEPHQDLPFTGFFSLRDPDNIPHATWGPESDALGSHNSPVKPKYQPYLDQYGVDYMDQNPCQECGVNESMEGTDFCEQCADQMMGRRAAAPWEEEKIQDNNMFDPICPICNQDTAYFIGGVGAVLDRPASAMFRCRGCKKVSQAEGSMNDHGPLIPFHPSDRREGAIQWEHAQPNPLHVCPHCNEQMEPITPHSPVGWDDELYCPSCGHIKRTDVIERANAPTLFEAAKDPYTINNTYTCPKGHQLKAGEGGHRFCPTCDKAYAYHDLTPTLFNERAKLADTYELVGDNFWTPEKICPYCDHTGLIYSDGTHQRCGKCGHDWQEPSAPSLFDQSKVREAAIQIGPPCPYCQSPLESYEPYPSSYYTYQCHHCNEPISDDEIEDATPRLWKETADHDQAIDLFGVPTCPECGSNEVEPYNVNAWMCLACGRSWLKDGQYKTSAQHPDGPWGAPSLLAPTCPNCNSNRIMVNPNSEGWYPATPARRQQHEGEDEMTHLCLDCDHEWGAPRDDRMFKMTAWTQCKGCGAQLHDQTHQGIGYCFNCLKEQTPSAAPTPKWSAEAWYPWVTAYCPKCHLGGDVQAYEGDQVQCNHCDHRFRYIPDAPQLFDPRNAARDIAPRHDQAIDMWGRPSCPGCGSQIVTPLGKSMDGQGSHWECSDCQRQFTTKDLPQPDIYSPDYPEPYAADDQRQASDQMQLFEPPLEPLPCARCGQAVPPATRAYGSEAWFCGACDHRNNIPFDKREQYGGYRYPTNLRHDGSVRAALPHGWISPNKYQEAVDAGYQCPKGHAVSNREVEQSIVNSQHGDDWTSDVWCPECQADHPLDKIERAPTLWSQEHEAASPQLMYHVAPQHARESIAQYGLDHSRGQKTWPSIYEEANYLFSDWDSAYAQALSHSSPIEPDDADWAIHPVDIYRVNPQGLELEPDANLKGQHMVRGPIPPNQIERIPDWERYDIESPDEWRGEQHQARSPFDTMICPKGHQVEGILAELYAPGAAPHVYHCPQCGHKGYKPEEMWPTLFPRTSSSEIPSMDELSPHRWDRECYEVAAAVANQWPHLKQDAGFYVHPTKGPGDHGWNIAPDGTIVDMSATQHEYEGSHEQGEDYAFPPPEHPEIIPPDHPYYSRYVSWERNPEQAQTISHNRGEHVPERSGYVESCPLCNPEEYKEHLSRDQSEDYPIKPPTPPAPLTRVGVQHDDTCPQGHTSLQPGVGGSVYCWMCARAYSPDEILPIAPTLFNTQIHKEATEVRLHSGIDDVTFLRQGRLGAKTPQGQAIDLYGESSCPHCAAGPEHQSVNIVRDMDNFPQTKRIYHCLSCGKYHDKMVESSTVWSAVDAEDLLGGPMDHAIGEPSSNGTWPTEDPHPLRSPDGTARWYHQGMAADPEWGALDDDSGREQFDWYTEHPIPPEEIFLPVEKRTAGSPLNVWEIAGDGGGVMGRRPFVYVPEHRTVYLGLDGDAHGDFDEFVEGTTPYYGEINMQIPETPVLHYEDWGGGNPDHDQVLDALRQHTGEDIRPYDQWHTAANERPEGETPTLFGLKCPRCQSSDVYQAQGFSPKTVPLYHCNNCPQVWKGNEDLSWAFRIGADKSSPYKCKNCDTPMLWGEVERGADPYLFCPRCYRGVTPPEDPSFLQDIGEIGNWRREADWEPAPQGTMPLPMPCPTCGSNNTSFIATFPLRGPNATHGYMCHDCYKSGGRPGDSIFHFPQHKPEDRCPVCDPEIRLESRESAIRYPEELTVHQRYTLAHPMVQKALESGQRGEAYRDWDDERQQHIAGPYPDWSMVPPCPHCGGEMDFRDSASLGPLYPEGAWSCYDCGNVFPLGEIAPESLPEPPEHPDPWMDSEPGTMTFPKAWA